MKVLHVQTALGNSGNAAFSLHTAMLKHGIESKMLMNDSVRLNNNIKKITGIKKFVKQNINRYIIKYNNSKIKEGEYLFTHTNYLGTDISKHNSVLNADVIYLHWVVGGFLTLENIRKIAELGKPIVFFMHDMWNLTGGCHHSFDCKEFENGCFYCPKFKTVKKKSFASKQFIAKKKLYDEFDNFYFVSPSNWLDSCAQTSALIRRNNHCFIYNIVDETVFKPFEKNIAKKILNIPIGPTIIAFGSVAGTSNEFKGWKYLKNAIGKIDKKSNIVIIIYGSDYSEEVETSIPFPVKFLGKINDETSMVVLNNATDIYISPSLAESFGLTFLENIMCNTPVVGFNVGGVPEIINHKKNGYLVKCKNSLDLANGINYLLKNKIIPVIPEKFFSTGIVQKHIVLIDYLLGNQTVNK